jgi:hypothetical protein
MSKNINFYSPQTGRRIKEDNSIVNTADMIEAIYNALVVDKNAGMQLSGSYVALSTEPKPTEGVKDGDSLILVDTKQVFKFYAGEWWEL